MTEHQVPSHTVDSHQPRQSNSEYHDITQSLTAPTPPVRTQENGTGASPTHTNGSPIQRNDTRLSQKSRRMSKTSRDPNLDINLPYRTLTGTANLEEYTSEKPAGEIQGPIAPDGKHHYKLVTFLPDDPENPKNWSKAYKWWCTMVVAFTCFVVALCSSVISADIMGMADEFGRSEQVALVSISIFVVGFGVGTLHRFNIRGPN